MNAYVNREEDRARRSPWLETEDYLTYEVAASARNVFVSDLIRKLLKRIAKDDLFKAILDD